MFGLDKSCCFLTSVIFEITQVDIQIACFLHGDFALELVQFPNTFESFVAKLHGTFTLFHFVSKQAIKARAVIRGLVRTLDRLTLLKLAFEE